MIKIDRNRFARHLLIEEIGEEGQIRLSDAHFLQTNGRAAEVAADYLRRAGAKVNEAGSKPIVLPPLAHSDPYQTAIETIRGACAAIEAIRRTVGLPPRPPCDPSVLTTVDDD